MNAKFQFKVTMKRLLMTALFISSLQAHAFLDFNNYGADYKDNNWPVWTPMYWMEKVTNNDMFGNKRNQGYGYPYNNRPYNINASHFDMSQMPTPDQAYQAESNKMTQSQPMFMTPAAQSFVNPGNMSDYNLPSPYPSNYRFNEPPSPYSNGF